MTAGAQWTATVAGPPQSPQGPAGDTQDSEVVLASTVHHVKTEKLTAEAFWELQRNM